MNDAALAQYLNAHLAGSVAGIQLARRLVSESRGSGQMSFAAALEADLEKEQEIVRSLLKAAGQHEDLLKQAGAWAAEKVGFFSIDRFSGDAALLRILCLEGLLIGSFGRASMWEMLHDCRRDDPRFSFADFGGLQETAERHCAELNRLRLKAAREGS